MVSWKVTVTNPVGLHMRPACRICEEALKFECDIKIKKGETAVDAKSLLHVLGAGVRCGDEIEFECSGKDEEEAKDALMAAAGEYLISE